MLHELTSHLPFPTDQQPFPAHAFLLWTKLRIWSKLKLIQKKKKKGSFTSDSFLDLVQWVAAQTFLLAQGRKQNGMRISCQVEKEVRTAAWGSSASWKCTWNCSLRCFIFAFFSSKPNLHVLLLFNFDVLQGTSAVWVLTYRYLQSISQYRFIEMNSKVY